MIKTNKPTNDVILNHLEDLLQPAVEYSGAVTLTSKSYFKLNCKFDLQDKDLRMLRS